LEGFLGEIGGWGGFMVVVAVGQLGDAFAV